MSNNSYIIMIPQTACKNQTAMLTKLSGGDGKSEKEFCPTSTKNPENVRQNKQKKTARTIVQTVFLLNSGIGIRTPTYRVRVCCATFTQYRYQLYLSEKFVSLSLTVYIISDSFLFVNTFFEISSKKLRNF